MPKQFNSYPSTRIVIDSTEIFIYEITISNLVPVQTPQYMVGISPNGAFTFVSKLWTGRVTDKKITAECGILKLLEKGEI